ncbi:MAG: sulfotransferase [Pseudomonadota bacterium]
MALASSDAPVRWLFLATLPGSGSTLLADLLCRHCGAGQLAPRAEGQWLVPDLARPGSRWDPDWPPALDGVRRIWLDRFREKTLSGSVLEKSPPNLCRMRRLMTAFADMPQTLVRLVRDPFAVCEGWARYPNETIFTDWAPGMEHVVTSKEQYWALLGDICGKRMTMVRNLGDIAVHTVRYERLVATPLQTLTDIAEHCPGLAPPETDRVDGVEDRNRTQLQSLEDGQKQAFAAGLRPYTGAVEDLGYSVDAPLGQP